MVRSYFIIAFILLSMMVYANPQPGDVFKEFVYDSSPDMFFAELDPNCPQKADPNFDMRTMPHMVVKKIDLDLKDAVKAEMSVEYWGGHIGTTEQKFKVNGNDWIYIPQPKNTPSNPECYYRTILGNESVSIPLSHLKAGNNAVRFTAGPQSCYNFNWGFYWIYSFTIRIYYKSSRAHPEGKISSIESGATVSDSVQLAVSVSKGKNTIQRVDYIGYYEDFDWDGDGEFTDWQYQTRYGVLRKHIASSLAAPYQAVWHLRGTPDQQAPMKIMAKITDVNGMCYLTPAIENIMLKRDGRSVKMYKSNDVPENFGVRVGRTMTCHFDVTGDPEKAKNAHLVLSTWSAAHASAIGFNGRMLIENIGNVHNYSYDSIDVPVDLLKKGENEFYIFAKTEHHAAEVNWPGPVLIVEYEE